MMMSKSKRAVHVSVVVPTYKRSEMLIRCLAALMAQNYDATAYEVIVADDAACVETRQIVEAWTTGRTRPYPHHTLRYVPVIGNHGPAAARNAGWRAATGDIIAFTDDDCIPSPGWLSAGVAAFTDGVLGVSGKLIVPMERNPTDYERNAAQLANGAFITANCFYRRSCLEAIAGFDENFITAWREDSDLIFRLWKRFANEAREMGESRCNENELGVNRVGARREHGLNRVEASRDRDLNRVEERRERGVSREEERQDNDLSRVGASPTPTFCPFVYAPEAIVLHPVRPAQWGISLKQQRKSMFNALLYKKHPRLYRQNIQATPPWHYYGMVGSLFAAVMGICSKRQHIAFVAACLWLFLTGRFCLSRLQHTSDHPSHRAEMLVTSVLIPPLAIFWRIRGAVKFRVFFL